MMRRIRVFLASLSVIALLSGCSTLNQHISSTEHLTTWSEKTAVDLNKLHAEADDESKEWLETKVNPVYWDAADMIETHTDLVIAWKAAKQKPADIDSVFAKIQTAILRVSTLITQFKTKGVSTNE